MLCLLTGYSPSLRRLKRRPIHSWSIIVLSRYLVSHPQLASRALSSINCLHRCLDRTTGWHINLVLLLQSLHILLQALSGFCYYYSGILSLFLRESPILYLCVQSALHTQEATTEVLSNRYLLNVLYHMFCATGSGWSFSILTQYDTWSGWYLLSPCL